MKIQLYPYSYAYLPRKSGKQNKFKKRHFPFLFCMKNLSWSEFIFRITVASSCDFYFHFIWRHDQILSSRMSNSPRFLPPVISLPKKQFVKVGLIIYNNFFFSKKAYNTVSLLCDFYLYFILRRDQILISRMPNSVVENSFLITWL